MEEDVTTKVEESVITRSMTGPLAEMKVTSKIGLKEERVIEEELLRLQTGDSTEAGDQEEAQTEVE